MKTIIGIMLLSIFALSTSCNSQARKAKFIVTTKVSIKPGQIDQVLKLFKETNPELVKGQVDWLKAIFTKNMESNSVMVQAYWKSKSSYLTFRKSEHFQETMKSFGEFFAGKPEVEINEILFEM